MFMLRCPPKVVRATWAPTSRSRRTAELLSEEKERVQCTGREVTAPIRFLPSHLCRWMDVGSGRRPGASAPAGGCP